MNKNINSYNEKKINDEEFDEIRKNKEVKEVNYVENGYPYNDCKTYMVFLKDGNCFDVYLKS